MLLRMWCIDLTCYHRDGEAAQHYSCCTLRHCCHIYMHLLAEMIRRDEQGEYFRHFRIQCTGVEPWQHARPCKASEGGVM